MRVLNADGEPVQRLPSGEPLRIEIEYELLEAFDRIIPGIQFISEREEYAYGVAADHLTAPATPGVHRVLVDLPTGPFVGGRFLICIGLSDRVDESGYHHVVYRDRQDSFEIVPVSREGGLVRFPTIWAVDGTESHAPIAFGPPVVAPRNGH